MNIKICDDRRPWHSEAYGARCVAALMGLNYFGEFKWMCSNRLTYTMIVANKNCNNYVTTTVIFNPTLGCDNRVP